MKLSRRQVVSALLIVVLIGGIIVFRAMHHAQHMTHEAHEKATYYCPMHPTYTSDRPGDCPICNMKLVKREAGPKAAPSKPKEKKILYWTDPMIPGYKSDKPGKSPMGMDLVPVYEAGAPTPAGPEGASPAGYAPIHLTPQKQQLIGVKTDAAKKRLLTKTIRTVGQIAYDPELYQAQQEYLQALRALEAGGEGTTTEAKEQARRLVEAASMRLRLLGLSEDFIQKMRGWKQADQALLLSDSEGRLWLYAPIYEFELPLIQMGQKVQVEVPSISGKVLEGAVESIDAVLDPMTRSARVRALLIDPEKILRPQMYVNALIVVAVGEVLSVPVEAVMDSGTRRIVFVEKGEGIFEPREVVVGVRADSAYEIKEGLREGEKVVISGNFLIDSESRLKSALEKSASGGEHQHAH